MLKLKPFRYTLLLLCFFVLGCTTYVASSKKDLSYKKKATELSVVWMEAPNLAILLSRSAQGVQPSISTKDVTSAKTNSADLLSLFGKNTRINLIQKLKNASVSVVESPSDSHAELRILAESMETECAPLGCINSIWIRVSLIDREMGSIPWTAKLKVGAPFLGKNDVGTVNSFCESVITQLKVHGLI